MSGKVGGVTLTLVALIMAFACSDANKEQTEEIKIGALVPLTGVDASWGNTVATTLIYARDEINAEGGVLGRKLKVILCDYGEDPAQARKCMQMFLKENIKFVVGPDSSEILLNGICEWDEKPHLAEQKKCPLVSENKITVVGTWPTVPIISEIDDNGYIFRIVPSDENQARILAKHIASKGVTSISIIHRDDWDGRDFVRILRDALENPPEGITKVSILASVPYPPDKTKDFKREIQKLYENGDPQAIFLYTFNEDGVNFLVALRTFLDENNKRYPLLFGCDANQYPEISGGPAGELVKNRMEGTTIFPPEDDPDYAVFVEKIRERFGDEWAVDYITYDAIYLLAAAIEASGKPDPETVKTKIIEVSHTGEKVKPPSAGGSWKEIKEKIRKNTDIDYKGVSGQVDLTENGELKGGTYMLWKITDTKGEWSDFIYLYSVSLE